jgi:hypothetical protein
MRLTNQGKIVITASSTFIALLAIFMTGANSNGKEAAALTAPPEITSTPTVVKALVIKQSEPKARNKARPRTTCSEKLVTLLYQAGFRGENLREAWAIAMRESNGNPTVISNGVDVGLFQFNYPSHGNEPWWDWQALTNGLYNARIAYRLSRGGKDWSHWGLTGTGQTDPSMYGSWSATQVEQWITEPYQRYYRQYPC